MLRRTFAVLVALCTCLSACQKDDGDGQRWSVDASTDSASDTRDSTTSDSDSDTADTAPDADASTPDYPSFFIQCQPQDEGPAAESPYRAGAPATYTLENAWSATPELEYQEAFLETTSLGAPSLLGPGSNGRTEVRVTAQTTDADRKIGSWYAYTDNGEVRGTGATGSSADLFGTTAAAPTTRSSRGSAAAIGSADAAGGPANSFDVYWDFSADNGGYSYISEVSGLPDNPDRVIGRLGLFPGGRAVVRWGHRWLVGVDPEFFRAEEGFLQGDLAMWWASETDLWPGASQPQIRWVAGPRPGYVVALLESGSGDKRWVEIDRCGVSREIYTAENLTRDIVWTGDDYLVLRDEGALPGGPTPVRALDGEVVAEGDVGCRDLVERRPDEWACLRQSQSGFESVDFGRDLVTTGRAPIPTDAGVSWSRARLHVAGQGGALVFAGIVLDGGTPKYGVATRTTDDSSVVVIEPEPGDAPDPANTIIHNGILAPDGNFIFSTDEAVYAVQTDISGLANTRFPRAIYGGNEARGYVEP